MPRFQRDPRQWPSEVTGLGQATIEYDTPLPPPRTVQALKPVGVAAVAVLALYSRQPPSVITPGTVVKAGGSGLASCSFLPAVLSNGCSPLRAAVTETGSLVVFKGGKEVRFWCWWRGRPFRFGDRGGWCCLVVMNDDDDRIEYCTPREGLCI